jgi:hypothetical protein
MQKTKDGAQIRLDYFRFQAISNKKLRMVDLFFLPDKD